VWGGEGSLAGEEGIGTVRPDWISLRDLKKDINRFIFLFFYFDLEYLTRVQNFELLHTKIPLIILLVGITGCMGTNRNLFHRTVP
jgi:hypothetical protein